MSELVLTDRHDAVLTLTLNQPDKYNALSRAMLTSFTDAVHSAERDEGVRAVVLTGAGTAFCSGADVSEFEIGDVPMDAGELLRQSLSPVVARLHTMEKPVIAAINGVAAGAGLSLALACDVRYAAQSARLTAAFIRIGLVPDAGMMYFLPRLIGPGKTLELAWTGDAIEAEAAYELGMLNGVLPDDQVLSHVQSLAARLCAAPLKAVALIKRAVNQAHELPLERVLELEAMYQTIASRDPNFKEGVRAFLEKRTPRFNT